MKCNTIYNLIKICFALRAKTEVIYEISTGILTY